MILFYYLQGLLKRFSLQSILYNKMMISMQTIVDFMYILISHVNNRILFPRTFFEDFRVK